MQENEWKWRMNKLDLTDIQYSVAAHRHQLCSEITDSRVMQRRLVMHLFILLSGVGRRMVKWGTVLQAVIPKEYSQDLPR